MFIFWVARTLSARERSAMSTAICGADMDLGGGGEQRRWWQARPYLRLSCCCSCVGGLPQGLECLGPLHCIVFTRYVGCRCALFLGFVSPVAERRTRYQAALSWSLADSIAVAHTAPAPTPPQKRKPQGAHAGLWAGILLRCERWQESRPTVMAALAMALAEP